MTNYLPQHATIEEACEWLSAETGENWSQSRLLESNLTPWFWIEYDSNHPYIFGGKIEGYLARAVFQGDITRLAVERSTVRVNMFTTHDGEIVKAEPAVSLALSELRYLRDDLEEEARCTNNAEPAQVPGIAANSGTSRGLEKKEIANAFAGLHFDSYEKWEKNLATPPDWLKRCCVTPGRRGHHTSALWNPVDIGLALLDKKISLRELNSVFNKTTALVEWKAEWREKTANER